MTEADLKKATAQIEAETNQLLKTHGLTMRDVERIAKERSGMDQAVDLKSHMQQLMASSKIPAAEKKQTQRSVRGIPGSGKGSGRCRSRNKCGSSSRNSRAAALRTGSQTRRGKGLRWQGISPDRIFPDRIFGIRTFAEPSFLDAIFRGADCSRADFSQALLDKADFSEARCESSIFNQVVATGASFQSAQPAPGPC